MPVWRPHLAGSAEGFRAGRVVLACRTPGVHRLLRQSLISSTSAFASSCLLREILCARDKLRNQHWQQRVEHDENHAKVGIRCIFKKSVS